MDETSALALAVVGMAASIVGLSLWSDDVIWFVQYGMLFMGLLLQGVAVVTLVDA